MSYKTKPAHFDHPLWELSGIFTEEEALKLLPLVRAGDAAAKKKMAEGYMRLALTIAGTYYAILKSNRWVEDLVSAAMLGVAEGVDRLHEVGETDANNPKALICQHVHRAISSMLDESKLIKVSRESQAMRQKQGRDRVEEYTRIYSDDDNELALDSIPDRGSDTHTVEEVVDNAIDNQLEADIVRLRLEGFTDNEIADQLGISRQTVQVIRQDLDVRVSALLPQRKSNGKDQNQTITSRPSSFNNVGTRTGRTQSQRPNP